MRISAISKLEKEFLQVCRRGIHKVRFVGIRSWWSRSTLYCSGVAFAQAAVINLTLQRRLLRGSDADRKVGMSLDLCANAVMGLSCLGFWGCTSSTHPGAEAFKLIEMSLFCKTLTSQT